MKANLRRRLLWLWLVFSVLWAGGCLVLASPDYYPAHFICFGPDWCFHPNRLEGITLTVAAFAAPLALLALGSSLLRAVACFRPGSTSRVKRQTAASTSRYRKVLILRLGPGGQVEVQEPAATSRKRPS
jgi:hypothetical protein